MFEEVAEKRAHVSTRADRTIHISRVER